MTHITIKDYDYIVWWINQRIDDDTRETLIQDAQKGINYLVNYSRTDIDARQSKKLLEQFIKVTNQYKKYYNK